MLKEYVPEGIDLTVDKMPPEISEVEPGFLSSLICVDHGYKKERPGYTASGFIVDSGHIVTAAHNLNNSEATVINPESGEKHLYRFINCEPDTTVSYELYDGKRSDMKVGVPHVGDTLVACWLRHDGGGEFAPHTMWGENIGLVEQGGKVLWGFKRHGDHPKQGDSGAMIVAVSHNGVAITPEVVGVFRGIKNGDEICVFSPLSILVGQD